MTGSVLSTFMNAPPSVSWTGSVLYWLRFRDGVGRLDIAEGSAVGTVDGLRPLLVLFQRRALFLPWFIVMEDVFFQCDNGNDTLIRLLCFKTPSYIFSFSVLWLRNDHFCLLFLNVGVEHDIMTPHSFHLVRDLVSLNTMYPERKGSSFNQTSENCNFS